MRLKLTLEDANATAKISCNKLIMLNYYRRETKLEKKGKFDNWKIL